MKLDKKVAIITGGAGGIGLGIATAFVKEGATVAIVDLNKEAGEAAIEKLQKISPQSIFLQADLTAREELPSIVEQVVTKLGKLDVLVNNAHASRMKSIEEMTQEDIDLSFNTGFYPTLYLMQAALPHLKESKGSVINFSSGAGLNGDVNQGSYAAAKEAIRGITRVAANEWGEYGITCNLISPIAKTPGIEHWGKENPEAYQAILAKNPLGRLGDPEKDIGRTAVFLASEDASYITGQTMMVDGGSIKLR
ncbi:NAD(P)-dependent oxidoreductase [Sporosarcina sp. P26b]|uniref:SDR family NAD(P)-dependent oxidoreductase n=1 Tax=Sporosarcina TaxID=1569 RepID=UPI000A17FBF1|nr:MULTISPECIES: SDR family oxidoreductase [Sporosarcina]ARK20391.1 oxidoreductase [Sporosarcina ureae]PIC72844.1 NAD(P)-dependent oxidoreductase [Sporosarcina sp. P17b]PIC96728.1 NAD(P)-dependent oxidoreductase [Sporosarcina sp. P26b]